MDDALWITVAIVEDVAARRFDGGYPRPLNPARSSGACSPADSPYEQDENHERTDADFRPIPQRF